MKLILELRESGEDEVIIRCRERSAEIERLIGYIEGRSRAIAAFKDSRRFMISPEEVIYLESVDGTTYLYTQDEVLRTPLTLAQAEAEYTHEGYFRCSKSMIINIYRIEFLRSEPGNRIDACMDNGEHVVISRHYSKELRAILKGGRR